jgi:hypothetical protein
MVGRPSLVLEVSGSMWGLFTFFGENGTVFHVEKKTFNLASYITDPDAGLCNFRTMIDERTRNSLSIRHFDCLMLRLIFVLASIVDH